MDDREIKLSGQHIALRAAAFFLALALAALAFGTAFRGLRTRTAGYYPVEPREDEEALRYGAQVQLSCYFAGSSTEIRTAQNRLQKKYGELLKQYCRLLEPWELFEGSGNLALLNRAPGETVQVDPALVPVLSDALEKTGEGRGYSLFAGPFYREWNTLLYLERPEDFDPLRDPAEAERLEALAALTNTPGAFALRIEDAAAGLVRLEVSPEARNALEELEYEGPVLDLNLLREAYLLRLLGKALEAEGCTEGYLSGAEGTALALSANREGEYCLYGLADGTPEAAASAPAEAGSAFCMLRSFSGGEEYGGYYVLTEGEGQVYRHPFVPCTGAPEEGALRSACVFSGAGDPAAARYACLLLFFPGGEASPPADPAAWTAAGLERKVLANPAGDTVFSVREGSRWEMDIQ